MTTFRNPAARDAAWGRYYRKRGLAPVFHKPRSVSNPQRMAVYASRRALSTLIRF